MRQNGYDDVAGDASSRDHVTPPSVERMSPQRLLGRSGSVATTFNGFSGSTAMSGVPYWRDGTVSNFVACTGLVTRMGLAAKAVPGAMHIKATTAKPIRPRAFFIRTVVLPLYPAADPRARARPRPRTP